ncbi:chorismate synthase [Dubosiella muris]|uniref:Chorismate synthase n=1 Tax=Dubosiella muris TaxID=3038133 RepID=A0AC61RBA1_9FIRM|nr:chorismate synthase [Dubosiella muris]TGY67243.1 chorismate synthase [Dubosiella muris]
MKNSIGSNVTLTVFGESHGPLIGAVLDGLPAGFAIDMERLRRDMARRKAKGKISTQRHEADEVHIVSGFFEGRTTGTPLTLLIQNTAQRSADYASLKYRLRPSHADWSAFEKYHGFQDYRGGGHFSGRLTAVLVACGSICRQILAAKGVKIGAHLAQVHTVRDVPFCADACALDTQIEALDAREFPAIDEQAGLAMVARIEQAACAKDSVGGVVECAITHFPAGVGEPLFDSVESVLSHALFSIPAIKGVEFGEGFGFAALTGSEANDALLVREGKIETKTNRNAGINGGITNAMPIVFRCVVKPTPSIFQKQQSVRFDSKEEVELEIQGRHDPCIAHRACVVIESMSAFALLDLWMSQAARAPFEEVVR